MPVGKRRFTFTSACGLTIMCHAFRQHLFANVRQRLLARKSNVIPVRTNSWLINSPLFRRHPARATEAISAEHHNFVNIRLCGVGVSTPSNRRSNCTGINWLINPSGNDVIQIGDYVTLLTKYAGAAGNSEYGRTNHKIECRPCWLGLRTVVFSSSTARLTPTSSMTSSADTRCIPGRSLVFPFAQVRKWLRCQRKWPRADASEWRNDRVPAHGRLASLVSIGCAS